MPFRFDGRDYDLFLTREEFTDLEKTGKLEGVLTNFRTGEEIGAKVLISVASNINPEGVELMRDYKMRERPEKVVVKVSLSALEIMRRGEHILTTYGVTSNKVRIGIYLDVRK